MKTGTPYSLLITLILSFAGIFAAQGDEVRYYDMSEYETTGWGSPVRVKISWRNIKGLDAISGTIYYAGGDVSFSGRNSSSGYIWWNDENGTRSEFSKITKGSSFQWVGKTIYRGHQPQVRLVPVAGGKPNPGVTNNVTVRNYWADMGGARFSVTVNWHNIKGLGNIDGHFDIGGQKTSFSGNNPSTGHISFRDAEGNQYKLWKDTSGNKVRWAGNVTTPPGKSHTFSMTAK